MTGAVLQLDRARLVDLLGDRLQTDGRVRKGDAGHLIVVGGSRLYGSSPFLAGMGALRTGVDTVRVLSPQNHASGLAPSLNLHACVGGSSELDADETIRLLSEMCTALQGQLATSEGKGRLVLLIGPGLGGHSDPWDLLRELATLRQDLDAHVVIDGSLGGGKRGLTLLAELRPVVTVVNAAEARQLTSALPSASSSADLERALAEQLDGTVVFKGVKDTVVWPGGGYSCPWGHPALTKNGTGDVLAGAIAGLLAKGWSAVEAAAGACYLVGSAGRSLSQRLGDGYLASEVADELAPQLMALATHKTETNEAASR